MAIKMDVQGTLVDLIVADFLQPTIDRLSEQLHRNITLVVKLVLDGAKVKRQIASKSAANFRDLVGEVRIVASDTAISGRYKYNLQCVLPDEADLEGFSGIRLNGAILLDGDAGKNDYSGFAYTYNEWGWGKKVRDL
jgi:hypothetical protein